MTWRELRAAAAELARAGRQRLDAVGVALLGTLRKDGSPRIRPIEPFFADGLPVLGAMVWSLKVRDLERDPRCVLHSTVSGPESGAGELNVGRAVEVDAATRDGCAGAWWIGRPSEAAWLFTLAIESAAYLEWDVERGRMSARRWSPARGVSERSRPYP